MSGMDRTGCSRNAGTTLASPSTAAANQIRSKALAAGLDRSAGGRMARMLGDVYASDPASSLMSEDGPQPWLPTFRTERPSPPLDVPAS